ncbi:MAG: type II toxin-antitoxin system Phd/YefM family antitoxin [Chloroflexi bacterium]|nr:type II toxin-antitoxin system Phd/YefM family antitoxin [Chloroflexota bacterium]
MPTLGLVPETVTLSDLRQRQSEIFAQLQREPLVLVQRGKPVAVLIAPDQWNRLMEEIEDLEDALIALKAELALATGADDLEDWERD